ncbi:MAG: dephospho-CoA kinase [Actinomycetota bacterium]|nr:dephospho-CoA kinase [Actinomycetota bacterium]
MLTVGLTGGIASGKSTVAGYLVELGAVAVDADLIAREVMSVGTDVYSRLAAHFGGDIIAPDGSIDRGRLAAEVFDDPAQLDALNRIVHPATIERIQALLDEWRADDSDRIGVVQVPLLIEAGLEELFDVVLVVVTTPEQQISRLMEMGLTVEQGLARLRSQANDAERLAFADFTLLNKGDIGRLKEQAAVVYARLKECVDEGRL